MAFGLKKSGNEPSLTTRQGHPVYDNQNQRTVGARGPATLENYHFLEKISHFDRERIPERVVHARGVTITHSKARRNRERLIGHGGAATASATRMQPVPDRESPAPTELVEVFLSLPLLDARHAQRQLDWRPARLSPEALESLLE